MSDSAKKIDVDDLEQVVGGKITGDDAYNAALRHARVTPGPNTLQKKCKLDHENGRLVYEVEFIAGGMEYEYDIDAATGEVLKFEKDHWD